MTIFNRMTDTRENEPKAVESPTPTGGFFTVMFGTEDCALAIAPGQTIKSVFQAKSEVLGLDYDRKLSYRDNEGNIFTGDETPVAGHTYLAAVTHDSKGV